MNGVAIRYLSSIIVTILRLRAIRNRLQVKMKGGVGMGRGGSVGKGGGWRGAGGRMGRGRERGVRRGVEIVTEA